MKRSLYGGIAGAFGLIGLLSVPGSAQQATPPAPANPPQAQPRPAAPAPQATTPAPVNPPQARATPVVRAPQSITPAPNATQPAPIGAAEGSNLAIGIEAAPASQNTNRGRDNAALPPSPAQISRPGDRSQAAPVTPRLDIGFDAHSQYSIGRLRRIVVLRQLLNLGITSADISAVLPMLRSLQNINTAPPADPDRAIEDEYQALLLASPGKPAPPSSANKVTDAARFYREEQGRIWSNIARRVGNRKADGLRGLLGQDRVGSIEDLVTPDRAPRPRAADPFSKPVSPRFDHGADNAPAADPFSTPVAPQLNRGADNAPTTGGSKVRPSRGSDAAPSAGEFAQNPESDQGQFRGPEERFRKLPDVSDLAAPQTGAGVGRGPLRAQSPVSANRGVDVLDPVTGRLMMRTQFTPATIRISLAELIDLLQEKLNAMSRARSTSLPGERP